MRIITLAVFLLLFGCSSKEIEKKVPIVNFAGVEPYLNKNNDSTYIVNFWATWCTPCVKEFPYFEMVAEKYQDKKVKVVMVNLDFPDQYQKRLIPFLENRRCKLDVVMLDDADANSWINRVSSTWSGSIPFTVIYNSSKRSFYETTFEFDELETALINHL